MNAETGSNTLLRYVFNHKPYSIRTQRYVLENFTALFPRPRGTRFEWFSLGGVPARWTRGHEDGSGRVIYYLHGGGFVTGSSRSHRFLVAWLCKLSQSTGVCVEYRRAPEDPFPAALVDALAGYRSLLARGVPAQNIVLAGDSAGGGLAVSLLLVLSAAGDPLPTAAYLMSPWVDLTSCHRPFPLADRVMPELANLACDYLAGMYAGEHDPSHPLLSPVYGDLSGLPPLYVAAGRGEPLRSDAERLVRKAEQCGTPARLHLYPGPLHVAQALAPFYGPARRLLEAGARFLKEHCPADGQSSP
ncbi:MAG: alpha/beta hydrolase [Deltaproteobacteria bacterium]|nr:alpha/beta hydrolase [Deltaproteobacteria bacterium]